MNMRPNPLSNRLRQVTQPNQVSFHTPGHKSGPLCPDISPLWDTTEIHGTDNLHNPREMLKEAEDRAAAFYGSDQSYYLVNGSTCGIYAMILAATQPGDEIIINRNAHQSVYNSCFLGGLTPRYILPPLEPRLNLPLCVELKGVKQALNQWPKARAVVVTRPTYHGYASDLKAIAALVKASGKLLLVDEAHGAHLRLSPDLPEDAMACGAHASVQSTHKTLTAFTQASLLHVKGQALDRDRLRRMLRLFQSSSPSYLLMASLDEALGLAEREGSARMGQLLESMKGLRRQLEQIPGVLFSGMHRQQERPALMDPTRLWVDMRGLNISGYELDKRLREEWHLTMELSDQQGVLALATIGNSEKDLMTLGEALTQLARKAVPAKGATGKKAESPLSHPAMEGLPPVGLPLHEALQLPRRRVPLAEGAGGVVAESIIPYPPGIPWLVAGEVLELPMMEKLRQLSEAGAEILGLDSENQINLVVNP